MTIGYRAVLGIAAAALLAGCAGQTEQLTMQTPAGPGPAPGAAGQPRAATPRAEQVTFPNGTTFGGASGRQASTLAQIVVDSNNNNMKEYQQIQATQSRDFQQLQGAETKNLQTSQQALQMLEQLSNQQGTGQITLFFATGQAAIPQGSLSYTRLVNFLDYLSRESRGRKVLFLLIGSASTTGNQAINERLSRERAASPEPIIDQYLVNVPHQFFKVYGLGDVYSPKGASLAVDERYQNVRIVAVYDTDQVPALPPAPRS
jgi:outer membrane protein OmpA-like peptidoglycan-associated protein